MDHSIPTKNSKTIFVKKLAKDASLASIAYTVNTTTGEPPSETEGLPEKRSDIFEAKKR